MYDAAKHHIISNASCTTNCLAPVAKVIPLYPRIKRTGRGSLARKLVATDDWDSSEYRRESPSE